MNQFALVTAAVVGSLSQMAPAASETDTLRNRCATQERQITELEKEIDSLHALLAKNNTSSQRLAVATTAPTNTINYKVAKGDSLSKIARKHGVSLNALMVTNKGINPSKLSIGQTVNVPSSATVTKETSAKPAPIAKAEILPAPIPAATHAEVPKAIVNTKDYVVQKGDTLYGIARKYNTSVANILEQNQGLDPRKLRPGQSIAIATAQSSSVTKKTPTVAKQAAKPVPVVEKETPKKKVAKSAPAKQTTQQVKHSPKQSKVRTVSVTRQMTFGEFASTHGSSVEQINVMNGLKLTKSTVLAQGSELYIPGNQH
jgi:LysM repeat protein